MDSNSLYYSLELVAGSGHILNLEQRAALQTSLVLLKKNYKFHRILFWGKILGIKGDYFIAQGRGEHEIKDKKNLYSFNCMDWFLLPPATDSIIEEVSKVAKGRFVGDPSFMYEHQEIHMQGKGNEAAKEEEEGAVKAVTEEKRLAVAVHQIDEEVSVVPRGAFVMSPRGLFQLNRSFGGLSEAEARKLDNFLHFRQPKNMKKKSVLELDYLDTLDDDIPKGSWSLQFEFAGKVCVLRSLLWLGLTFYHVPMTPQHGYIYIGHGTKNLDLPFMI